MAEINSKDVMSLRNKTGLPMMACKAALAEAGGDPEKYGRRGFFTGDASPAHHPACWAGYPLPDLLPDDVCCAGVLGRAEICSGNVAPDENSRGCFKRRARLILIIAPALTSPWFTLDRAIEHC